MSGFIIFFIPYAIIVFGLFYSFYTLIFNHLIEVINGYISAGSLSTTFLTYWSFALGLITILPFIFLLVLGVWVYRASQEPEEVYI